MLADAEVRKANQNAKREKVQAEIALTRAEAEAAAIEALAKALTANPLMANLIAAE